MLKTVRDATGKEVKRGDLIISFRGEPFRFQYATRARVPGRSGKIVVAGNDGSDFDMEFYDKVFDLTVSEA